VCECVCVCDGEVARERSREETKRPYPMTPMEFGRAFCGPILVGRPAFRSCGGGGVRTFVGMFREWGRGRGRGRGGACIFRAHPSAWGGTWDEDQMHDVDGPAEPQCARMVISASREGGYRFRKKKVDQAENGKKNFREIFPGDTDFGKKGKKKRRRKSMDDKRSAHLTT
jgi:hypothetical protein